MTDGDVVPQDGAAILADVEDRVILNVRARADADGAVVRADDDAEPDARFLADLDVADQNGRGCHERRVVDFRRLALVLDEHANSPAKGGRLCLTAIKRLCAA